MKKTDNLLLIVLTVLVFGCNITVEENSTATNIEKELTTKITIKPKVVKINPDSLIVILSKGKVVKAGIPKIVAYTGIRPIEAGTPNVVVIDKTNLKVFIPGKESIPLPKKYTIQKQTATMDYSIQHGDTIFTPKVVQAIQPHPIPALLPRLKDAAICNIQYLNVEQGMYYPYVISILEDKSGNLWFGTEDGVSKYDGKSFTHYTEKEGLSNNIVRSILEDENGNLWFGTDGGVNKYDGESFTHYTKKEGLSNNRVYSILEDKSGNLWFGTWGGGVNKYDGKSLTHYTEKEGLSNNRVYSILEDKSGNLWFGTWGGGVNKYDGESFTHYTEKDGLSDNIVRSILEDKSGNLWFGTEGGVNKYDGKSFTHYTEKEGLSQDYVWSILEDRHGNLWFGTWGGGINKYDGKSFTHYTEKEGLSDNRILDILEDKSGNLWFGTWGSGVNKYDGKSFTHYTEKEGLSDNMVMSILEDKSGNLWFSTWGGGVNKYDGKSVTHYTEKEGLSNNIVRSILEDRSGNLWFGTDGGVNKYNGESFTHYTEKKGLSNNIIMSILEDKSGNLWFGTDDGGVNKYDGKSFTHYTQKEGLSNNRVYSILEDIGGNLWFGTQGGVNKYDGKSFTHYTQKEGLSNNSVMSILEDKTGNLWFGTDGGGVNKYDGKSFTHYTQKEGLSDNIVRSILEDKSGNLWFGTYRGLNYFEFLIPEENEQRNNINITVYDGSEDGLKGLNFSSVCFDGKNRLWAGTDNGLTMLDLNKFENTIEPLSMQLNSINIEQSFIDYRMLADIKNSGNDWFIGENMIINLNKVQFTGVAKFYNYPLNLELPYHLNHITFNFSAIDWAAPHKIQYKYKLDGLDKEWSTKTKENKADYRNIPYGTYTFKVKAIGIANVWGETFEYTFTIHPPWWFSWWAYAMYVVTALLLIFLFLRWRIAKLKQRQKELELTVKERTVEVIKQKNELQEKNEELTQQKEEIKARRDEIESQRDQLVKQKEAITKSIEFAYQIQSALLPPEGLIKYIFPRHFILFKPRDIVSGDFYWISLKNNKIIFAIADCTGHGVPGALMSMLGGVLLNEVVNKIKVLHANGILNELRDKVNKSLRLSGKESEAKTGIDIAMCIFDTENKELQFSGACNPLYLIRDSEVNEIKADTMPVGIGFEAGKSFTNHIIKIQKGDTIYLFSDGYADQFGGPMGKKFKYNQFKQLLLNIQDKIMIDQKKILEQTIEDWMNNTDKYGNSYKQVDDILVMGLRF